MLGRFYYWCPICGRKTIVSQYIGEVRTNKTKHYLCMNCNKRFTNPQVRKVNQGIRIILEVVKK